MTSDGLLCPTCPHVEADHSGRGCALCDCTRDPVAAATEADRRPARLRRPRPCLPPPREELGASAQGSPEDADAYGMTAPTKPRIAAADLRAAAARLAGVVVLDVADLSIRPALYDAKAATFTDLDGELLGEDDGTLIVLVEPGTAADLIATHGQPHRAAEALTRRVRQELAR